ncbi:MAG: alpha-amylase family glycosyl hydrolase, partial [Salinibacter sp.]
MPRRLVFAGWMMVSLFLVGGLFPAQAQEGDEPVVETDPAIPTASQSVTITFNADQGDQGLEGFDGDVYAHTGVYTDQSPNTWRCVKNNWPTEDDFTGNREDTKLTQVGPEEYELTIDDIRAYYNDNDTGCTLDAEETVETMNFVFRSDDGSEEGKAEGGEDIIVDLGDSEAPVLTSIQSPSASLVDPIVVGTDTTLSVMAIAQAESSLEEFTLSVNGTEEVSTTGDTLTYDVTLDAPGRKDVRVEATDDQGNTASDSIYAVRASPSEEQAVPSGLEDGINYTGSGGATLVLQAPEKQHVHVVGDFTDWEVKPAYQMQRETNTTSSGQDSTRYWIELDELTPGQEYGFQYLVDGDIRIPDPYSEKVLTSNDSEISESTYPDLKPYPSGKAEDLVSVLETGQSEFDFSTFERPEQEDLVIYELLVRDFIEDHNYQTLQDTLDYLDGLGVNAIELMPVSEYDGNESWGYNPALYFATDKYYGPAEELKQFIELAHERGIAVILDVVYNHQTGQSPFIRLFNEGTYGSPTEDNPWANPEARHPFNVFNDNDHESTFTKYWLDRANEYWLTEFNVDGFRFDLSKGFTQTDTGDDVEAWSSYDQSRIDHSSIPEPSRVHSRSSQQSLSTLQSSVEDKHCLEGSA